MIDERIPLVIERMFSIQDKEGRKIPFILNNAQRFFFRHRTDRTLIAKARQKGFSSVIIAEFTVRCLGVPGTRAVVMSHEGMATQRLLDRAAYYLKHMKGPRPSFGRHSRNEFFFDKLDSSFYIGTAGAKAFGRGDTVTDLHCSEYAWWENADRHHAGIFQAVPRTGRIVVESTGNGRSNDFYFMWKNADKMGYTRLFYPWYADDEYTLNVTSWRPDTPGFNHIMLEMKERFNLTDQQMAWWESKFRELREDIRLMNQEYPTVPDDCFQATGGSVFPAAELSKAPAGTWNPVKISGYHAMKLAGHPQTGFNYVLGADPSGGTGNDDAAIVVLCVETGEQVFEFYNNTVHPLKFAEIATEVGRMFNDAFIVCEANNHGIAVIAFLRDNYPRNRLYKSKPATKTSPPRYGWINTKQSKHNAIAVAQDYYTIIEWYGEKTVSEMLMYEEQEEGKFEAKSDNLVIAACLAMIGFERFVHLYGRIPKDRDYGEQVEERPPRSYMVFTLDEALDSIRKRKNRPEWLH